MENERGFLELKRRLEEMTGLTGIVKDAESRLPRIIFVSPTGIPLFDVRPCRFGEGPLNSRARWSVGGIGHLIGADSPIWRSSVSDEELE